MDYEHDHFTSKAVDEQIEQLSQQAGQPETPGMRLVRGLRRFYAADAAGQRARSLEHAWERITETGAYARQAPRLPDAPPGTPERKLQVMKTQHDSSPLQTDGLAPHPILRPRRFGRLAQALVAVLVVGVLLGGFAALYASRHTPGSPPAKQATATVASSPVPAIHNIVVTADQNGVVYGIRPGDGTILWRYHTGQPVTYNQAIIPRSHYLLLQGDAVYFVANEQVFALRAADGSLLWHRTLTTPGFPQTQYNQLAFDNGHLYVGGEVYPITDEVHNAVVVGIQASDGTLLWQAYEGNGSFEPLLAAANGLVFVWEASATSTHPALKALYGEDGHLLWNYTLTSEPIAMLATGDAVYVYLADDLAKDPNGFHKEDKSLLALGAQDGKFLWSELVTDYQAGSLVMDDGLLILGINGNIDGSDFHFCAYRPANGAQVWCVSDGTFARTGNATGYLSVNGTLYSVTYRDVSTVVIEARRASDGNLLWSNSVTVALQGGANLAVLDGTLYVTTDNGVVALNASDGHTLWNFSSDGGQFIGPVAAGSW